MPTIEEHRRLAVGCRELEPARRGPVGRLHLGDDAGERAIAQAVFGKGEHIGILSPLCVKDAAGPKADLFETGCVQVELGERPQHREVRLVGEPRRDACGEQGRRGVIRQRRCGRRNLVETSTVESLIDKPLIERFQAERQHRSTLTSGERELCAKRSELVGAVPIGRHGLGGHLQQRLTLFAICSRE